MFVCIVRHFIIPIIKYILIDSKIKCLRRYKNTINKKKLQNEKSSRPHAASVYIINPCCNITNFIFKTRTHVIAEFQQ